MRSSVKNKISVALVALVLLAITLPGFVVAQTRSSGNTGKGAPTSTARRPRVSSQGATPATIGQDFQEALTLIQQNHIDGNKLDYNDVYKSSILRMLRSLAPHSSYFE